jgi:hypothetical protein
MCHERLTGVVRSSPIEEVVMNTVNKHADLAINTANVALGD